MNELLIRAGVIDDAEAIARVHVLTWQHAYKGLIPETYLRSLSIEKRRESWVENINYNSTHTDNQLLVATSRGHIIGFSRCGPARDDVPQSPSELYAIYISPDYHKKGIGQALFARSKDFLISKGFNSTYVWSLEGNKAAHSAYERWGGIKHEMTTKELDIDGTQYTEIIHSWLF